MIKLGDGTAPPGFPAYGKYNDGIRCNFNNCGHTGTLDSPSKMNCQGKDCHCPCCRMLAGIVVFGCRYGT